MHPATVVACLQIRGAKIKPTRGHTMQYPIALPTCVARSPRVSTFAARHVEVSKSPLPAGRCRPTVLVSRLRRSPKYLESRQLVCLQQARRVQMPRLRTSADPPRATEAGASHFRLATVERRWHRPSQRTSRGRQCPVSLLRHGKARCRRRLPTLQSTIHGEHANPLGLEGSLELPCACPADRETASSTDPSHGPAGLGLRQDQARHSARLLPFGQEPVVRGRRSPAILGRVPRQHRRSKRCGEEMPWPIAAERQKIQDTHSHGDAG